MDNFLETILQDAITRNSGLPLFLWLVMALLWINFVTIPVIKTILAHRPKPSMDDLYVRDGKIRIRGSKPAKNRFSGLTDD